MLLDGELTYNGVSFSHLNKIAELPLESWITRGKKHYWHSKPEWIREKDLKRVWELAKMYTKEYGIPA